jgi:pimeloyl-ACP methyl ester carboxylesterase
MGRTNEVTFTAAIDGTRQCYAEILPEGFEAIREYHVLIALHGHGSDRWQYVRDQRDECRAARDTAAKLKMIFISPDYRAKTSWMGPKAEADLVQIIEKLRREYRVGRVFLVGGSMGGSAALTFGALHPDLVAGICSENGTANHLEYDQFQDAVAASFGGTKRELPLEYKKRSAEYWPEVLTMPLAITAGGKDTVVPAQSVLRLAEVLRKLDRPVLVIYREAGGHQTDYADTTKALEFVIGAALAHPSPVDNRHN